LQQAAFIKGFDHLATMCKEFETWYNGWRPHMTLDGLRPDEVYYRKQPETSKRDAKTVPCNIKQYFFRETKITGYRLNEAA